MKKLIAVVLSIILAFAMIGTFAFAQENDELDSAQPVSFSDEGIRLEDATPEEIEDIGVGAMLQAGLISESDANISDVTPVIEPEIEEEPVEKAKSGASTLEIVLLVLVIILILAVAALYILCGTAGVFYIEEGHPLYNLFRRK